MAGDSSVGGPRDITADQNGSNGGDDGEDVGVIMSTFPDGPLGSDGNKPVVVAQFVCEEQDIIFVSYLHFALFNVN